MFTHILNGRALTNYMIIDMDKAIIRSEPIDHPSNELGYVTKGSKLIYKGRSGEYVKVRMPSSVRLVEESYKDNLDLDLYTYFEYPDLYIPRNEAKTFKKNLSLYEINFC